MATTFTLISSTTLTGSQATVTFSSIPSTYTDLVIRSSVRTDDTGVYDGLKLTFNSDTAANYSYTLLYGTGSAAVSSRASSFNYFHNYYIDANGATASTFGNSEIYIPSYLATQAKPVSNFGVAETNATAERLAVSAALWNNTAAISSIQISPSLAANFQSGSTFYLYGIKNS